MKWEPGLYSAEQAPESVYHADEFGDVPTLSRSTAAELVNDSPADVWDRHPRLGGIQKRKITREMELASLVHSLLLGSGPGFVTLPERYADFKTDAAKVMRDNAREEGKIPILYREASDTLALANRLRPQAEVWTGPLLNAQREVTALWEEEILEVDDCPNCGGGGMAPTRSQPVAPCWACEGVGRREVVQRLVRCRARMDLWVPNHPAGPSIFDLKVVESTGEAFERSMTAHGLDIQAYVYPRAMEHAFPELAGRINFVFLLCRNDGRYVVPVTPCRTKVEVGRYRWERGLHAWATCLAKGTAAEHWPGPPPREVEASDWEMKRELAYQLAEGDEVPDGR